MTQWLRVCLPWCLFCDRVRLYGAVPCLLLWWGAELVLADGRILGHRQYVRYYKQKYKPEGACNSCNMCIALYSPPLYALQRRRPLH